MNYFSMGSSVWSPGEWTKYNSIVQSVCYTIHTVYISPDRAACSIPIVSMIPIHFIYYICRVSFRKRGFKGTHAINQGFVCMGRLLWESLLCLICLNKLTASMSRAKYMFLLKIGPILFWPQTIRVSWSYSARFSMGLTAGISLILSTLTWCVDCALCTVHCDAHLTER